MAAHHAGRWLVCGALLSLSAGCGGGDGDNAERPDFSRSPSLPSPTRTLPSATISLPSPSRSEPTATDSSPTTSETPTIGPTDDITDSPSTGPTEPPVETDSDVPVVPPTRTAQPTATIESTTTPTETETAAVATPTTPTTPTSTPTSDETDSASGDADASDDGMPAWVWWALAGALVVAALLAGVLLARMRARRRRQEEELGAAKAEVAWLARDLLPQLRSASSLSEAAGGWRVGAPRVAAAEDRLTAMAADERHPTAERARMLRDAVRSARGRLQALVDGGTPEAWSMQLDGLIAGLETALAHDDRADEEKP